MTGRSTIGDYASLFASGAPLLDVRAPIEYAKGAFPGAVNLPLMNDEERHEVGIRYKDAGQDAAIALGAELLDDSKRAQRIGAWQSFVEQHPNAVLYCFRGGLRSRITQDWLSDIGVDIPLVQGGYKALRQFLIESLATRCASQSFVLLGGRTCTGKTDVLVTLKRFIDLEALADHRGSSFGKSPLPQPTNIDFENALAIALMQIPSPQLPLVLEDEARMIGRVCLPEPLRDAMQNAPLVLLEDPLEVRVQRCIKDYVVGLADAHKQVSGNAGNSETWFAAYAEQHRSALQRIKKRLGGVAFAEAERLGEHALQQHESTGSVEAYEPLIELLLTRYYDPMYDYQIGGKAERIVFQGDRYAVTEWMQHRGA